MKKLLWLALMVASIGLAVSRIEAKGKSCCAGGCPTEMEGTDTVVANTADGVTVTISTKDPAKVKKLQDMAAKHFTKKEKAAAGKWSCPMDHTTSDKPGKCPKCGMDMKQEGKKSK